MSRLNILNFSGNDTQSDLVYKINNNFEEVSGSYGGYLSGKGDTGERGMIGQRGPAGHTGHQGKRGSRWFVRENSPTGPDINYGDYWLSLNGDAYIFSSSGWDFVENLQRSSDLFSVIEGVSGPSGVTSGSAIVFNQENPEDYSMVFSDNSANSSSNLNPLGAKFVISSDRLLNNGYILEFSKSNLDIPGSTGDPDDISKHPIFYWSGPINESNLDFINPASGVRFLRNGQSSAYDFNFQALNNVNLTSEYSAGATGAFLRSDGNQTWSAGLDVSFDAGDSGNFHFSTEDISFNGTTFSLGNSLVTDSSRTNIFSYGDGVYAEGGFVCEKTSSISRGIFFVNSHFNINYPLSPPNQIININQAFVVDKRGRIGTPLMAERYTVIKDAPAFAANVISPVDYSTACNWFKIRDISEMDGRTIFLDTTQVTGGDNALTLGLTNGTGYIGIGFDYLSINDNNLMYKGESITFRVICKTPSSEAATTSLSGISLVGFWGFGLRPSTSGTDYEKLGRPSDTYQAPCWRVDFTFMFSDSYGSGGPSYMIARGYSANGQNLTRPVFLTLP